MRMVYAMGLTPVQPSAYWGRRNGNGIWDEGTETNPLVADTDSDGIVDGVELEACPNLGANCALLSDCDSDGLCDGVLTLDNCVSYEVGFSRRLQPDTDGDGISDGIEVSAQRSSPTLG